MTLVARVSLFFLSALAACLVGYSVLSYLLIRQHLYRHFDEQLQSALNALVAAVEVESDAVKWQPSEHTVAFGDDKNADDVRWVITDARGHIIDRSLNLESPTTADDVLLDFARSETPALREAVAAQTWRVLQKRLRATEPKARSELDPDEFAEVAILVAGSTAGLRADLWRLTALVCLLPVGLWLVAAVVGRGYCRRALSPLGAMAVRAQSMDHADFRLRLPVAPQRDELTDLATAFNRLLDQLQDAFEKQGRFTGDAAHQLRTPLTVLRGEIDVALRRPRSEADYRAVLTRLREQTEELQQLVETLLFLARTTNGRPVAPTRTLDLADWLPVFLERWREHPRHQDLTHQVQPGSVVTTALPLLSQALQNLIDNALKYSPPGSPITVRAVPQDGSVAFIVEDCGLGVTDEERSSIFEPFYRSPRARQSGVEGTGLGLALVARIVQSLGGRITCESRLPHGSRFTLILPAANPRTEADPALESGQLGLQEQPDSCVP